MVCTALIPRLTLLLRQDIILIIKRVHNIAYVFECKFAFSQLTPHLFFLKTKYPESLMIEYET